MTDIIYNATQTSREFHADNSFCRINKGPVRSGKSVRCLVESVVNRAIKQAPAKDGIRYSRWVVGRRNYPQLKSTTIKTWQHWFPERYFGKIKWDSPITHHLKFNDVDTEILFLPIDGEGDIDKLKSLEITGGYLNELQYFPKGVLTTMLERCNSYPPKDMGAPITFSGVWADTNPPSTRHWIYELEKKLPANYKFFHDIPAVLKVEALPKAGLYAISRDGSIYINNPAADYIKNLPTPNYYLNQIPGLSDEEVKVTCMGQYGFTRAGKPVYPDYNDVIHFRNESIKYNRNETLHMGWDFGLTPAVAFFQWQEDGRLAQIGEITSQDFGVEKFAENIVLPFLQGKFPGWQNRYVSIGDPSGVKGNEQTASPGVKNSCFDALCRLGINTRPARTNGLDARIGAVSWFLRKLHNGRGALLISKDCSQSREGFLGDYQYEKITIGGIEESSKPLPLKNFSSHVHDAIQYILMYLRDMIGSPDQEKFELSGSIIY